ncbi:LysM peptidoglycan-binding domain-containing M23 family metallopeptidase [Paracoccus sp. (in: a-proteobacteria)]|uniref:LysM peptidoglycan-binding domain-containing M23 family metallopeptidase n=1 Tax=Paracoccus sp. TaxID=267 RepID=UPI00289E65BD|nr:LysM peptidoglycan-binding domain-containing M23 family metallopeptidase [Paracoccus sp. (in: a-proteobacteria)]
MTGFRSWAAVSVVALALASCGPNGEYTGLKLDNFDPDLRGFGGGLSTTEAAAAAQPRPQPDQRGVISYPGYQVAIARQGDTVATIAARLGLNAAQVAQYNAIDPNSGLNAGAVIALPTRVAGGTPAMTTTTVASTGQVTDPFAGQGVRKPNIAADDKVTATPLSNTPAKAKTTTQPATQPRQHVVASGETAWSIARKYSVTVNDLAQWNGLSSDMAVRPGQRLLIPVAGAAPKATSVVTAPGSGSPTPRPPSSAEALPNEKTVPASTKVATPAAPDMGKTRTAASGSGKFRMPVNGAIARTYSKGKNDGIDISAAPGAPVSAAGAGTVAAITRDVDNVPIIVVRHDNNLMTVYAGLDNVTVNKGDKVSAGSPLGKTRNAGIVHFEVRNGFESVDPEKYLN